MRKIPKKIIVDIECYLCKTTGLSCYHNTDGTRQLCDLCHGEGYVKEVLHLDEVEYESNDKEFEC